ncbi:MAG: hypothetical protein IT449_11675 [Phycisphaerales bacterium]|nr:hypothetical protein [Phycisphaerales bacterium]
MGALRKQAWGMPTAGLVVVGGAMHLLAAAPTAHQPPPQSAQATAEEKPIPVYVSWIGADSRIEKPEYLRITTAEEWAKVWHEHKGTTPMNGGHGDLAVPRIDFSACFVIAVFQGKSFNSNGVQVVSAAEDHGRMRVRFDDLSYQTMGPDGGGVEVSAYGLFVLQKASKPVVLEEDVQGLIGQPPKWKERARFEASLP